MSPTAAFIEKHPDMGARLGQLAIPDFHILCEREGIIVTQLSELNLEGFIWWQYGKAFIALKQFNPFIAFHELGHYFGWKDEKGADDFAEACTGLIRGSAAESLQ